MANPDIALAYKTHKGRRPSNEDACLAVSAKQLEGILDGLLIVADGMGGRSSGSVASATAVSEIHCCLLSELKSNANVQEALAHSFKAANDAIRRQAASNPEFQGMGTTCVAVAIKNSRAYISHMGDSRAYLLRNGELIRLTEDHSFVAEKVRTGEITEEQARKSRFRNVITRAVGLEPDAKPELSSVDLQYGDVLLLCTDGLTVPVSEGEVKSILTSAFNPEEACDELINAALRNGGSDNITAVVAAYGGRASSSPATPRKGLGFTIFTCILGLVLGIGIGFFGSCLLLTKCQKPQAIGEKQKPSLNLSAVEYEMPVSLSHVPLQGGVLLLDEQGFIHVVDNEGRLLKLDSSGAIVHSLEAKDLLKSKSTGTVFTIATDAQGNLYISDAVTKRIAKFAPDGLFLRAIGEGKLIAPEALAVDKEGNIFIIDGGRLKVIRVKIQR